MEGGIDIGGASAGELVEALDSMLGELLSRAVPESGDEAMELAERVGRVLDKGHGLLAALVGRVDATGAYRRLGRQSASAWLRNRVGMRRGRAQEAVVVGRQLARLPETARRLREGELPWGQATTVADALERVTEPEDVEVGERILLGLVDSGALADDTAKVGRVIKRHIDDALDRPPEDIRRGYERSWVRFCKGVDGGAYVRGWLKAEDAATVEETLAPLAASRGKEDGRDQAQRTADALVACVAKGHKGGGLTLVIDLAAWVAQTGSAYPFGRLFPTPTTAPPSSRAHPPGSQTAKPRHPSSWATRQQHPHRKPTPTQHPDSPATRARRSEPQAASARQPDSQAARAERSEPWASTTQNRASQVARTRGPRSQATTTWNPASQATRAQRPGSRTATTRTFTSQESRPWQPSSQATGSRHPGSQDARDERFGSRDIPSRGPGLPGSTIRRPDLRVVTPEAWFSAEGVQLAWRPEERARRRTAARLRDGTELDVEDARRIAWSVGINVLLVGRSGLPLYLGRTHRLASRAQRRALEALYETCCVQGCHVPSHLCEIHHLKGGWINGAPTDIPHLAPACRWHNAFLAAHPDQHTEALTADNRTIITVHPPWHTPASAAA